MITLPKALLRRRPDIMISTELVDMRTYIFSRWVVDFVCENEESVSGITEDLVPALINMQFRKRSHVLSTSIRNGMDAEQAVQLPSARMASALSVHADYERRRIRVKMTLHLMIRTELNCEIAMLVQTVQHLAPRRDSSWTKI